MPTKICSICFQKQLCNCAPQFRIDVRFDRGRPVTHVEVSRDGELAATATLIGKLCEQEVAAKYKYERHRFRAIRAE